jgi:GntR family transcriptional repressor for pyruvate dehydrogenase complex
MIKNRGKSAGKKRSSTLVAPDSASGQVVDHLSALIAAKELRPGDRLAGERDLATQLGVSRGEVRRGIGYLAALGALEVRHGVGAFLADAAKGIAHAPLQLLQVIGGFETWQMFEARRALEVAIVALAAERCREEQLAPIAEELAEMFATVQDAKQFLIHDIRFHRAIAQASGNPILASLMNSIAGAVYEERLRRAGTLANRQSALQWHRQIYHAIRHHDVEAARNAMNHHLKVAESVESA